jgi:hypothetical protein
MPLSILQPWILSSSCLFPVHSPICPSAAEHHILPNFTLPIRPRQTPRLRTSLRTYFSPFPWLLLRAVMYLYRLFASFWRLHSTPGFNATLVRSPLTAVSFALVPPVWGCLRTCAQTSPTTKSGSTHTISSHLGRDFCLHGFL